MAYDPPQTPWLPLVAADCEFEYQGVRERARLQAPFRRSVASERAANYSSPDRVRLAIAESVLLLRNSSGRRRNSLWRRFDGRLPYGADARRVVGKTSCRNMTKSATTRWRAYNASQLTPTIYRSARTCTADSKVIEQRQVNDEKLFDA